MLTLGLVCAKISAGAGYAILLRRRMGRFWRLVEAGGGCSAPSQPPPTSTTSRPSTNLPVQILNGTGANVMTKSTNAAHASLRRDAGSGRCASRTGGCPRPPRDKVSTTHPQESPPRQEQTSTTQGPHKT